LADLISNPPVVLSPNSPFVFALLNPGTLLSTGDIESFFLEGDECGCSEHEDSYYPNTNLLYLARTGNEWSVEMIDQDSDVDSPPAFKN
jgi:hypothetical protein